MLLKPVLIGLGVRYFGTMRATVYFLVCYQKVIFGKILKLRGFDTTVNDMLV